MTDEPQWTYRDRVNLKPVEAEKSLGWAIDAYGISKPYILATPEALSAAPEVRALISDAESLAETIWLRAVEIVSQELIGNPAHDTARRRAVAALKAEGGLK